ncbi:hypothetical protein ZIOFF_053577 [Zingiber officinale]|uniref:Uncharacterized protein n=1 Tax=Zingiber officinale TaxID=94328 RepID=A0A8J5FGA4_ZINOF|nr:hypothetical protein ZIOFF_053577 [Zingiber officinale]
MQTRIFHSQLASDAGSLANAEVQLRSTRHAARFQDPINTGIPLCPLTIVAPLRGHKNSAPSLKIQMGFDHHFSASSPPSLMNQLRSSIYLSCCFAGGGGTGGDGEDEQPAVMIRASATWIQRKARDLLKFGGKCRILASRIRRRHHSRRKFGYDPLSYALNFDEGRDGDDEASGGELLHHAFLSRLPPSPFHPASAGVVDA